MSQFFLWRAHYLLDGKSRGVSLLTSSTEITEGQVMRELESMHGSNAKLEIVRIYASGLVSVVN